MLVFCQTVLDMLTESYGGGMKNTTGTIFQWYVERNGDPQTRRSFTSESLAQ